MSLLSGYKILGADSTGMGVEVTAYGSMKPHMPGQQFLIMVDAISVQGQ